MFAPQPAILFLQTYGERHARKLVKFATSFSSFLAHVFIDLGLTYDRKRCSE